jgi:hypothetical protein
VLIMGGSLCRCLAVVVTLGVSAAAGAAPDAAGPPLETPPGAKVISVAADLVLNNRRCHVSRFQVAGRIDDVLQFYRTQFGPTRAIETRVKQLPVIATRRGDHLHTVQLQSVGDTVLGTTITTALHAALPHSAAARDTEATLPADSVIVMSLQSDDGGRHALMVIGTNRHSVPLNRAHVVAALQQRGFRTVRDADTEAAGNDTPRGAVSIELTSAAEAAVVTIADAGLYRTVLVQRTREAVR